MKMKASGWGAVSSESDNPTPGFGAGNTHGVWGRLQVKVMVAKLGLELGTQMKAAGGCKCE